MKKLTEYLVKSIVKNPKKVVVEETATEELSTIEISADEKDLGQVIGKKGKIIKALQALVQIKGARQNKRCFLRINDSKRVNSPATSG